MDDTKRERTDERMQADEAFDAILTERVHSAYGQVQLPEESFSRMLGQLSQASAGKTAAEDAPLFIDQLSRERSADAAGFAVTGNAANDANPAAAKAPAKVVDFETAKAYPGDQVPEAGAYAAQAPKRDLRVLRFALPVAACLMVALVAGVVAFNLPMGANDAASPSMEATNEEPASQGNERDSGIAYEYADEMPADSEDACEAPPATPEDFIGDNESEGAMASDGEGASASQELDDFDEEGSSSKSPADSLARDFPRIELASGHELRLVADSKGNPQVIDSDQIVQYLEDAKAYPAGSQTPEACAIYVTADGAYAASFKGDPAFYLVNEK